MSSHRPVAVYALLFLFIPAFTFAINTSPDSINKDSILIHHKNDGNTAEWPLSKFETDVSTDISYAIDNDKENLYLAMNIPNEGIQMKLEKMGMKLFIDLKGKRKEGRGIAFPVKDETALTAAKDYNKAAGITDEENEKLSHTEKSVDKRTMHSMIALRHNYMNVFGFEGIDTHDQGLNMPGSINIAFAWDTADVLHIEYIVPLKMLETRESLNQKDISVGWKINGIYPSDSFQQSGSRRRPRNNASAAYGPNTTGFDPSRKIVTRETIIRENNFWGRYIINI
ncbi:MAG: hypothetical protein JST09_02610 [Bacteroidetes bacterium]|nr:hypothetical protein [Bacteroidota bacterium]